MATDPLPPAADALYGLPLEDFVAERAALAKRLRADGDRAAAKQVDGLRKPSVAAWTVNQLVRSRKGDVGAFADAAERLRSAQAGLLEGRGSASELREAREAERGAVARLLEVARGLFPGGREPGEATLERVSATLHAAAADDATREEVLSGRLLRERETSGFGDLDVELAAALRPKRRPDPERGRREEQAAARRNAERERRARRAALQAALDQAVAERERAEAALAEAREEEARRRAALEEAD